MLDATPSSEAEALYTAAVNLSTGNPAYDGMAGHERRFRGRQAARLLLVEAICAAPEDDALASLARELRDTLKDLKRVEGSFVTEGECDDLYNSAGYFGDAATEFVHAMQSIAEEAEA